MHQNPTEEVQKKAYEIVSEQLEKPEGERKSTLALSKEYHMDRSVVANARTKIKIEKALLNDSDTSNLAVFNRLPVTIFKQLLLLEDKTDLQVQMFFTNFASLLNGISTRAEVAKKLKECVEMYCRNEITSYHEYVVKKEDEAKAEDEQNVFDFTLGGDPFETNTTLAKDNERESIITDALKKQPTKQNFSIKAFTKNIFEESKSRVESLKTIFSNKTFEIEYDEKEIDESIKKIKEAKQQLEELELLLKNKKGA